MDQQGSTLAQNTTGAPYAMYTATFGNVNFLIQPSMTGKVSNTFGQIPYVALESIIYAQAVEAQTSPINIQAGQNTGQQNIQGSTTITDSTGLPRMVMGYSENAF